LWYGLAGVYEVVDPQPPERLPVALVDVTTAPQPGTPAVALLYVEVLALASLMAAAGFFILMNIYAA
jgi:hypothetical protein